MRPSVVIRYENLILGRPEGPSRRTGFSGPRNRGTDFFTASPARCFSSPVEGRARTPALRPIISPALPLHERAVALGHRPVGLVSREIGRASCRERVCQYV